MEQQNFLLRKYLAIHIVQIQVNSFSTVASSTFFTGVGKNIGQEFYFHIFRKPFS